MSFEWLSVDLTTLPEKLSSQPFYYIIVKKNGGLAVTCILDVVSRE